MEFPKFSEIFGFLFIHADYKYGEKNPFVLETHLSKIDQSINQFT